MKPIIKFLKAYNIEWWFSGTTTRNLLLKKQIKSYNVSVNATIEELKRIFKSKIKRINKNSFSVQIVYKNIKINLFPLKKLVNNNYVSYYEYVDNIRDDAFSKDFCVNAIYYNPIKKEIIDPTNSRQYIKRKELKIIGNPEEKILANKLILLRSATLLARLGEDWKLNETDKEIIKKNKLKILTIPKKAIYKEISKLLYEAEKPSIAFNILKETEILNEFFPELDRCFGIPQSNKSKNLDLYQHIMYALDSIPPYQENSVILRLAALLHDIGKPYTQLVTNTGLHFYGHEYVGANIAEQILYRWGFKKEIVDKVVNLVKNHLFDSKLKSYNNIRKLILRVGVNNIHNLLDLRIADRLGTGRKNISMKKVEDLREKVNQVLSILSPENIKLRIADSEIKDLIKNYVFDLEKTTREIKNYLIKKIILDNTKNKKEKLIDEINKLINIKCPLGYVHLFKTWSLITSNEHDVFPNGKLRCGIFCNFLCDRLKNKLI